MRRFSATLAIIRSRIEGERIDVLVWAGEAESRIPADIRKSVEDIGEKTKDGLVVIKEADCRSMKDVK